MSKSKDLKVKSDKNESDGSSGSSLNTERQPATKRRKHKDTCNLCDWFERRMTNTNKKFVRHVEKFHLN